MDNNIVEFSAENNEKMLLIPGDGGVIIRILPATNLPSQTAYDMFEIGLRKSSLKSLSRALHKDQKYSTNYYQNIIWRDNLGKIHFHNKTNIRELPEYICILDVDQSTRFVRWVNYYANGLPIELDAFTSIQDIYVQDQLAKLVEEPSLLNLPKYWDELGMSLGTAGFTNEAMNCFRKALQLNPEHHISKLNMAVSLDAIGKPSEALDLISQVPNGIGRRNIIMANTLCSAGMELDAIPYYEKAVAEEPDFFLPFLRLLEILFSNNHPLFEYWLEKALETHRRVPVIAHFYTDLLLQQKRIEELVEIDWLDELQNVTSNLGVVGRDTDDPSYIALAQLNHKIALIYRDGDDQALSWAIHQLSNIPDGWNVCMQSKLLASAAVQSGHPELISTVYERVCPTCKEQEIGVPRHLNTLLAKGHENQENWGNAIKCCENVLALDPNHIETLSIYYWNLDNDNQVEKAIQTAEHLYTLVPSQPHLPYNIGYLQGKSGFIGKAEFYYRKQLELEPKHWVALENLSFIHLLSAKFTEAQEAFVKSLHLHRNEYLNAISDFSEEEIREVENFLYQKSQKFSRLLEVAQKLLGDSTYAFQLQKVNMADELIVGANTAIERNPYSLDNVLAFINSGAQAEIHEVQFQLAIQKRGDYSMRLAELINFIPMFYRLPTEARSALVEGEKRFKDNDNGDFFSVIVAFSKAVEICIKKIVFEPFRSSKKDTIKTDNKSAQPKQKPPRGVEKFMRFVDNGYFIALGEMGLVLDICKQSEISHIPHIRKMQEFLAENKELNEWLSMEIIDKVKTLADTYRNKAVHSSMFTREAAQTARDLAIEVISALKNY